MTLAIAQARACASDVAVDVSSDPFALSDTRTHASHDPVDWKYHHVGNYLLNDVPPPHHGQL